MCNTDLSLLSQASCRKESCRKHELQVRLQHHLCPWVWLIEGNGFWIFSNMLFFPLTFSFLPSDRGFGLGSMLLSGSVLQTVKCLSGSLYTLNVRIKCLITLTVTAESHDSIRAPPRQTSSARLKQRRL